MCHAWAQVSTCNWDIWVLETRGSRLQSRKWLSYINVFTFLPSGSSNNFCDRQIIWWQHWFKDVNMILFPAGFVFMSLEERWTSSQITNWETEKDLLEKEPVKKKYQNQWFFMLLSYYYPAPGGILFRSLASVLLACSSLGLLSQQPKKICCGFSLKR